MRYEQQPMSNAIKHFIKWCEPLFIDLAFGLGFAYIITLYLTN